MLFVFSHAVSKTVMFMFKMALVLGFLFAAMSLLDLKSTKPLALQRVLGMRSVTGYRGSLLGVSCECTLDSREGVASLSLRGVPIGGRLAGTARFSSDGEAVILDEKLDRALARRLTKVESVCYGQSDDVVRVSLSLPIVGKRTITLYRDTSQ